ncbi:MAG: cupin-like domain-containing protein [Gaiellaceae bacterium MAG52_C11]|nr:cupin-like domain-containing protein [Candidatus Gaiellasilicea maunaloa]
MTTLRLPDAFATAFDHSPVLVDHTLDDHPLLTPEAVAVLADRLPIEAVEHNRGSLPAIVADGVVETVDQTPGRIAREIDTNGCWMVLKNIEQDPAYAAILDEMLDQVAARLSPSQGEMRRRKGFIFLSAPGSVTPSHFDPEHNFLLQVRGDKDMTVGTFPTAETERDELERYYGGGHRNVAWLPADERTYPLRPGQGVYVPIHAPHWVRNGDAVSVSLSITFQTALSRRAQQVHMANAKLRRLGLTPRPPGQRMLVDRMKAAVVETYGSLRRTA